MIAFPRCASARRGWRQGIRSPEITGSRVIATLNYLRIVPDLVFSAGAILIFFFVLRAAWLSFVAKKRAA